MIAASHLLKTLILVVLLLNAIYSHDPTKG